MFNRIRTRLFIIFIPPILLIIMLMGWWQGQQTEKLLQQAYQSHMQITVNTFLESEVRPRYQLLNDTGLISMDSYVQLYHQEIQLAAQKLALTHGGYFYITNPEGEVFGDFPPLPQTLKDQIRPFQEQSFGDIHPIGQEHLKGLLYVVAPFPEWSILIFYTRMDDDLHLQIKALTQQSDLIAAAAILILTLLILLFSQLNLIRPIEKLQKAANRIAEQHFIQKIEVTSHDEMGQLARYMESMGAALQKSQLQQREWQQSLEEKVNEQTLKIRLNEERLTLSQQIAGVGHWELLLDDHEMIWSDEIYRLLGHHPNRVKATFTKFLQGISKADRKRVKAAIEGCNQDSHSFFLTHSMTTKKGIEHYVEHRGELYFDQDGAPQRIIGVMHDITQRYQTEKELLFTRHAINNAADGAIWVRLDSGHIVFVNDYTQRLLGYRESDLLNQPMTQFLASDSISIWEQSLLPNEQNQPDLSEIDLTSSSGERITVEMSGRYLSYEKVDYLITFVHDIRERKALTEERNRIFQISQDLICIADLEGSFHFNNPAFTDLTGYNHEKLISIPFIDLVHPDDREISLQALSQLRQGKTLIDFENRFMDAYLHGHWLQWRAWPDIERGIFYAVARDISEQKLGREQLQLAKVEAEQANRAKSEFLANMSHEIRTPMNAMTGLIYLLQQGELNSEQHGYLKQIDLSTQSLLRLLNDILDLSKVEAGSLDLESFPFSVKSLMNKIVNFNRAKMEQRGNNLTTNIDVHLPDVVVGDSMRLQQILNNLLSNANKFTEKGHIELGVRLLTDKGISTDSATPRFQFWVQDSGIGIEPKHLQSIFSAFHQGEGSTTRRYGGTGLGLTICQRLAGLMGAEIEVTSTLGEGSCFSLILTLPLAPATSFIPHENRQPLISSDLILNKTILIAEDNQMNQMIITKIIQKMGGKVITAHNGEEAIKLLKKRVDEIDLIFMDIQMPVMDGYQASRTIRSQTQYNPIPLIAMTANAMESDRIAAQEAGMDDYITKPIDIPSLQHLLQKWLPS